jgi:hypothetical protein
MGTARFKKRFIVERVQTGVRMEKRLVKVLKALAEFHDLTLGDLLEGIVLHAFDGKAPFQRASRRRIKQLKKFYGLELDARASHRLMEAREVSRVRGPRVRRKQARARKKVSGAHVPGRKVARNGRAVLKRKADRGGRSR